MSVKTRSIAARAAAGSVVNAAANLAREQILADQVLQWTLEGRCYTASVEPETASVSGGTSVADVTQTFTLRSDPSGTKLVVPLFAAIYLDTSSGSGMTVVYFAMTRPWNDTAVLSTESGTALTVLNNLGVGYGNQTATALRTVTVAALDGTGDWTEIKKGFVNESFEDGSKTLTDPVLTLNPGKMEAPIVLYKGSALFASWYAVGGGASTGRVVFQWAELDASTYLP